MLWFSTIGLEAMCEEFGLDGKGRSADDMTNDLSELILFKAVFVKLWVATPNRVA